MRVSRMPICVVCDLTPERTQTLLKVRLNLDHAKASWRAAKTELAMAHDIVTSLPGDHPDGIHALRNANSALSKARKELHAALDDYANAITKKAPTRATQG